MRRVVIVLLVAIIAIALFVGLHPISPARTFDAYEHKAKDTAESVLSSVQNARLAARVGTRGDAFGPYVSVSARAPAWSTSARRSSSPCSP